MTRSGSTRRPSLLAVVLCASALAGCGKRGNPLPPIRPAPGAITDIQARRIGDRVELRFTIPAKNADGTVPAVIERVDVFAMATEPPPAPAVKPGAPPVAGATPPQTAAQPPAGQTPPVPTPPPTAPRQAAPPQTGRAGKPAGPPPLTPAKMQEAANLRGHIDVHGPIDESAPAKTPAAADARPAPGDVTTFVGSIAADRGAGPTTPTTVLQYLLVGVAGSRRTPSAIITIPLTPAPDPPTGVTLTYDEKTLTLAWNAPAPGTQFRVYEVDELGIERDGHAIGTAPIAASPFTAPVEFGKRRCFAVHAVRVTGPAAVESDAAPPVCQTPVDTFPPPVPALHPAVPSPGSVNLIWDAVDAADLAGYFVLRSDGADETLHALMTTPLTGTTYRDATPRAGVRYVYAIVAVDKAGNLSAQSNRVEVIGR